MNEGGKESRFAPHAGRQTRNTYLVGGALAINGVLRTVFAIVAARFLVPAEYGRFELVIYAVTVGGIVSTLGIQAAVFRYGTRFLARGEGRGFRILVRFAERLGLGTGAVLGLALIAASILFGVHQWVNLSLGAVVIVAVGSVIAGVFSVQIYALRAMDEIPRQAVAEKIIKPGLSLLGIGGLVLIGYRSPNALAVIVVASTLVSLGYTAWILSRKMKQLPVAGPERAARGEWLRFALPVFSDILLKQIAVQGGIEFTLLALVGAEADLGRYAVLFRIIPLILMPAIAASAAFGPHAGFLIAEDRTGELGSRLKETVVAVLLVSAPIAAGVLSHGEFILSVFGPEYVTGRLALNILLIGVATDIATGECRGILLLAGRSREYMGLTILLMITGAVIGLLTIPAYGLVGAAITGSVARLVYNLGAASMVYYFLGVHPGSRDSVFVLLVAGLSSGLVHVLRRTSMVEATWTLIVLQVLFLAVMSFGLVRFGIVKSFFIQQLTDLFSSDKRR